MRRLLELRGLFEGGPYMRKYGMWYHFFLHYGWFLRNLGKEALRNNMHTTVISLKTL